MNRNNFDVLYRYYKGRIVRHKGNRKIIASASIIDNERVQVIFVDGTKCIDINDIELDGRA